MTKKKPKPRQWWLVVDKHNGAVLCLSKEDAESCAKTWDQRYWVSAPHEVVKVQELEK